jgi:uncharacterized membrane protein (DUF373 family)
MDEPEPNSVDDEGLPRPSPVRGRAAYWMLRLLVKGEIALFMAIAVALIAIAVVVFVHGVHDFVFAAPQEEFAVTITGGVNNALFIVVVLELVRTIVARLEGGGFQLQPFLVIGIVSATRDILNVGAQLSLIREQVSLVRSMTELGVNAAVVLSLSTALVLVRRYARLGGA